MIVCVYYRRRKSTHATTHSLYSMEVMDVFCLDKSNKVARYKDRGNTKLLEQGSRLSI